MSTQMELTLQKIKNYTVNNTAKLAEIGDTLKSINNNLVIIAGFLDEIRKK